MFEDFRKQMDDSAFDDTEEEKPTEGGAQPQRGPFLGLKPAQRFIVVFMLLVMTVVLGILFLMVTNKIALPTSL